MRSARIRRMPRSRLANDGPSHLDCAVLRGLALVEQVGQFSLEPTFFFSWFFPPQEHIQAVSQTALLRARRLVRTNFVDELLKFGNERLWLPWLRHRPKTAGWIGATAEYNARAWATCTNDDNYIYIIYTFYILYTLFIHYIYNIYTYTYIIYILNIHYILFLHCLQPRTQ